MLQWYLAYGGLLGRASRIRMSSYLWKMDPSGHGGVMQRSWWGCEFIRILMKRLSAFMRMWANDKEEFSDQEFCQQQKKPRNYGIVLPYSRLKISKR
ncbi:hypothetical protein M0802_014271 [Mischocyttarus mexicanus]|nr:hypothetical protein M0802_014271 [Mischocyttarus mexicanus]